jgi:Transposase DDE domain
MTTQNSTPTRLVEYINSIFDNAHGHQRNALVDFVLALISTRSCCQASLARFFDNFEAACKRLSRFLHNPRLDVDCMSRQTARVIVSQLPLLGTIRLSIDWTIEATQHLLVASLCIGSRAIPVYWRAYKQDSLRGRRSSYERDFVRALISEVLHPIARSRLLITADRAFADVELMDLLNKERVCFVIRTKGNIKVYFNRGWRKLKEIRLTRNQRRRSLGRLRYCQSNPRRLFVTQSRKRDRKGKWGVWHLLSNRNMSATQSTQEYARRFSCEEGFRDAKRLLGFAEARINCIEAWARMFTLVAVAMLLLYGIGCYLLGNRAALSKQLRKVMSRRKQRAELSLMRALAELIRKDRSCWDVLDHKLKLNLLAVL